MPNPSAIIVGSSAKQDDIEMMKDFCYENVIQLKRAIQNHSSVELIIR